jgi:hypothetical protein
MTAIVRITSTSLNRPVLPNSSLGEVFIDLQISGTPSQSFNEGLSRVLRVNKFDTDDLIYYLDIKRYSVLRGVDLSQFGAWIYIFFQLDHNKQGTRDFYAYLGGHPVEKFALYDFIPKENYRPEMQIPTIKSLALLSSPWNSPIIIPELNQRIILDELYKYFYFTERSLDLFTSSTELKNKYTQLCLPDNIFNLPV